MYAAPLPPSTPYAPTSAVVPSADTATDNPRLGPSEELAAELDRIAPAPSRAWIAAARPAGRRVDRLAAPDDARPEPGTSAVSATTTTTEPAASTRFIDPLP